MSRQASILIKDDLLSNGSLGTNVQEIWIEIRAFALIEENLKIILENGNRFASASTC